VSSHDQQPAHAPLGPMLNLVLAPFEGRPLDEALVLEMAETLNRELASALKGRVIQLRRDGKTVHVAVMETIDPSAPEPRALAAAVGIDAVAAALAA
jgi:hypothetical protein